MAISVPTNAELLELAQAHFLTLQPDLSVSRGALVGDMLQAVVDLVRGLHITVESAWKDIFPSTAMDSATLERHAEIYLGPNPRKVATKSSGTDALQVTGTLAGASVTAGLTLSHTDGTRYVLTEGGTVGVGTLDVSLESISTGDDANKDAAEKLTFESAPANIQEEATLVVSLSNGFDAESDAELLDRLLDAIRNPPGGGRFSDYRRWVNAVTGVSKSYVYGPSSVSPTGRRGIGVVDVAFVAPGSGVARIPTGTLEVDVQDAIDDNRPDTTLDSSALTPDADAQIVDVQLTPSPGYEFDWTGAADTVEGWDAGSSEIELTASNASLQAAIAAKGSARVFVNGELLVADLYTAGSGPVSGGDEIRVTTTPTNVPLITNPLWPGGPLSSGALAAVISYMDTLGPAKGASADPNQVWDDTLRVNALAAALIYQVAETGETSGVQGVQDVTVVTPAANVVPTDHGVGGTVDLIIYPISTSPNCLTVRPT